MVPARGRRQNRVINSSSCSYLTALSLLLGASACVERGPGADETRLDSRSQLLEGAELAECAALAGQAALACQAALTALAGELEHFDAAFGRRAGVDEAIGTRVPIGACSTAQLLRRSSTAFLFTRQVLDLSGRGFSSSFEVELPMDLALETSVAVEERIGLPLFRTCQTIGTLPRELNGRTEVPLTGTLSLALDPRVDSDPLGNLQLIVHPTVDVQLPLAGLHVPLSSSSGNTPASELAAAQLAPAPVFLALQRELEVQVRTHLQAALKAQLGLDGRGELLIQLPAPPAEGDALQLTTQVDGFDARGVYRAPCATEARWASLDSQTPLELTIQNDSDHVQRLYWLDFAGQRQLFAELAPGARRTQLTFSTHPWLLSDVADRCEALVVALPRGIQSGPTALAGGGVADIVSDLLDPSNLVAIEVGGTAIDPLDPARVQWIAMDPAPLGPAQPQARSTSVQAAGTASLIESRSLLRIQTPTTLSAGIQYVRLVHRSGETLDWPYESIATGLEPEALRGIVRTGQFLGDDAFPVGTNVIQRRLLGDEAAEKVHWLYEINAFRFETSLSTLCDAIPLYGRISGVEQFFEAGINERDGSFRPLCGSATLCRRIEGSYQLGGGRNSIQLTIERTAGDPEQFIGGWVSSVPGLYPGQLAPSDLNGSYMALTSTRTGRQLAIGYALGPHDSGCF